MKSKKIIIQLLVCCMVAWLGWSCKKTPVCECFEVAGKPTTATRNVAPFNQIYVDDNINVFLSVGPQQVILQGGGNLLENIATNVSGGVLTLQNNNICNWWRSYKKSIITVYISSPDINFITSNGIGTIQSTDTLTYDTLQVQTISAGDINLMVRNKIVYAHMFGTSDLTITGKTNAFECNFFGGTGFVYADQLISGYTFISNSSTGDCYVNSNGGLDVTIFKDGNVYYSGSPTGITCKTYGAGQLIKE